MLLLKNKCKVISVILAFVIMLIIQIQHTEAATSPYDVDSSVKTGWNKNYGGKVFSMSSGKQLIYDVYSEKYTKNGYSIVTKDFGKGSQSYIRFQGWSILFGHYRHTATNHETYIVAQDSTNISNVKVYGTLPIGNLDATEELEYNNQGSGIWNECPSTAKNMPNYSSSGEYCNMSYKNVGFDAYLPVEDLFPSFTESKKWYLYLVKRVNDHIVYTPLIIPFEFDSLSHNGGTISLSSGVNARTLRMNSERVIKRKTAFGSGSGAELGYFENGTNYRTVTQNETKVAVWFGVSTSGETRWAASPYWSFGGDQAVLSFIPDDKPPTHISDTMAGTYQKDKVTWVQPNQTATVTLRQQDVDSGNARQYIGLDDGTTNVRSSHSFIDSSITNKSNHVTSSNLSIDSAKRLENTTYGKVEWKVTPKVHGEKYDLKYYYSDRAGNTIGYIDTGRDLRVDGVAPSNSKSIISGATYVNGKDYWIKSGTSLKITLSQFDGDSGNQRQYIRLVNKDGDIVARSRHDFNNSSNTFKEDEITNSNVSITKVNRTSNTTTGTLEWTVVPKKSGEFYEVQYYYRDNVNNNNGYVTVGTIKVDDEPPIAKARNQSDTEDLTSVTTPAEKISVRLKFDDLLSGYKESRYGWSNSPTVQPIKWSSWTTNSNYVVEQTIPGTWYLHVEAKDKVGNILGVGEEDGVFGKYIVNSPPTVTLKYSPTVVYEGDTVTLTSVPDDPDDEKLTLIFERNINGKWQEFHRKTNVTPGTTQKTSFVAEPGKYEIRVRAIDPLKYEATASVSFEAIPLDFIPEVNHTEEWKAIHEQMQHEENQFYSGEVFLTELIATDYPIDEVSVVFKGNQINGEVLTLNNIMKASPHPRYTAQVYDDKMGETNTRLANDIAYFYFTVKWSNGVTKSKLVNVNIVDSYYEAFELHRTN